MKQMTLSEAAEAVGGTLFCPPDEPNAGERTFSGAATDNRKVLPGNLFVPIVGTRADGHSFIKSALEAGAAGTFSQRPLSREECPGPYILVRSSEEALKKLAAVYRSRLSIPIVGIIGSVGKTSTKEMVASVLSRRLTVRKTEGNFNNEIGLPLTILSIRTDDECAVVEMGISDFGEMHRLGSIARPDFVVWTNVGACHLEKLGDLNGVYQAKSEIFDHWNDAEKAPVKPAVFLNASDPILSQTTEAGGAAIVFYGTDQPAKTKTTPEVYAENVEDLGLEGLALSLVTPKGSFDAKLSMPGLHNVGNVCAATAVGLRLGLDLEEIKSGIESARTIAGRTRFLHLRDGITVIDDGYNANPVSMKASLSVLAKAEGRKVAVLGDMGELGADEKRLHYDVGRAVCEQKIDVLYTSGTLSREIVRAVLDASYGCEIHPFDSTGAMVRELIRKTMPEDTILVKASHFMHYDQVAEKLAEAFS